MCTCIVQHPWNNALGWAVRVLIIVDPDCSNWRGLK